MVLRRDEVRQLMLSSPIPRPIAATFDLRDAGAVVLIRDALLRLFTPRNQVIRVIGAPVREAGLLIEVTMETAPLRAAMIDYGLRILSAVGGDLGDHRGAAVPGGAAVAGAADQGRGRPHDSAMPRPPRTPAASSRRAPA